MLQIRNIDRKVFAGKLGISQQALCKIIKSDRVSERTLERIASELNLLPEDIRDFDDQKFCNQSLGLQSVNISVNHTINYTINGLDDAGLERLVTALRSLQA